MRRPEQQVVQLATRASELLAAMIFRPAPDVTRDRSGIFDEQEKTIRKEVTMRIVITFSFLVALVILGSATSVIKSTAQDSPAAHARKPQDVYMLGVEAKLGSVSFSHVNHVTKNRNLAGTAPMACVECHHTAQPASDVAKHPPLKTAWPADRTTTLTLDLFEKEPTAPEMVVCQDCHSRADTKPKLLPELPQIKLEEGTALITLNNQQAFHRNCGGCHDEIVKNRKDMNPPTSKKCVACHKKAAA
jgi:cytochrome c553